MNLEGKKFSKLTAKTFKYTNSVGQAFYVFTCECGKEKTLRASNVVSGRTKSCGCMCPAHNKKPMGEAAFNKLYYMYKVNAIKRNLVFSIPKEDFGRLTKFPCTYCGVEPSTEAFQHCAHGKSTPYTYNGLDRVVNEVGYTLNNVVPCCSICNYAKHSMSLAEFLSWIDRLVKYRNNLKVRANRGRN